MINNNNFKDKTDIFFDLDHTLWDFEKNSALAFEKILQEYELPFDIDQFLMYYVDINADYWDKYSLNLVTRDQLRVGRLADTFKCLSYQTSHQNLLDMGDKYLEYLPENNYLLDGATELLDYLRNKDYNLHIITNGFNSVQKAKLHNSQIASYFQTVTDSELAGVKKPDSGIFTYALEAAKVQACSSVMVGDNLLADVQGAQKAGIDAVFYNQFHKQVPIGVLQVNTLLEIKDIL